MGQARTLQYAREGRDDARAAARDRRVVLYIPDIARAEFSGAAINDGQARSTDQRTKLAAEDFVAEAEFTAPSGTADVEATSGPLVTKDGHPRDPGKGVAGEFGGEG